MPTYDAISEMKKMLKNLDRWLEKGAEHAKAKSFDPKVLFEARLAPNQYPLSRQVQSACDSAKFAAARLAGKEAPKHPDTEATYEELRARITAVTSYLETFVEKDFEKADERTVPLTFMEGKGLTGRNYLNEMVQPNFFFHLTHAYAILRHNGVDLGKSDFIGSLDIKDL